MPFVYPPLTEKQEQFILTHSKKMSFRNMSKKIKTSEAKVRDYIIQHNLPYRKQDNRRKRVAKCLNGYFNSEAFFRLYKF